MVEPRPFSCLRNRHGLLCDRLGRCGNYALSIADKKRRRHRAVDAAAGPWRQPGALPEHVAAVVEAAKRYFVGEDMDFASVRVDLTGQDAFFGQITMFRGVGWGRTTTYGALAKAVGAGRERARDVGEAMAKNPMPLIIPCHRVLAAGGKMAVFRAGRVQTKARMLELEGVSVGPPQVAQTAFSF